MFQYPFYSRMGMWTTDRFAIQRGKLGDELRTYEDRGHDPVKPVNITLRFPTYSDLTPDQLDYYSYWKHTIGTSDFKKAADGYTWLLVNELINGGSTEDSSRRLNGLALSEARDGTPLYPELLSTAIEYALLNNTPMPQYRPWMCQLGTEEVFTSLVSTPVSDFGTALLKALCPGIADDIPKDQEFSKAAGSVFRAYDSVLHENGGLSFAELFTSPSKRVTSLFRGYVHLAETTPEEMVLRSLSDRGKFSELVKGLAEAYSGATPSFDLPFADKLAEIVFRTMRSGTYSGSPNPLAKHCIGFRLLGSEPGPLGPSRFNDISAEPAGEHRFTVGDLLTYGRLESSKPVEFVTSGFEHPEYRDLTPQQVAYYHYWKTCFNKGAYLDTDNGYVNILLTEIIYFMSPKESEPVLRKLMEIYGDDTGSLAGMTLADHFINSGLPFTDYKVCLDKITLNSWIDSFANGCNTVPLDHFLLDTMRYGSVNASSLGRKLDLEPFEKAMKTIFAGIRNRQGLQKTFDTKSVTARRSVYVGLEYLKGPKEKLVKYTNYLGCGKFVRFMDKCANYSAELQSAISEGRPAKKSVFNYGGVNCGRILTDEHLIWSSIGSKPPEKELVLDMDAVSAAESDLNFVTEAMKVEEEPEEEVVPETKAPGPVKDDPWQTFFASLDKPERDYLRACVRGDDTKDILRQFGATRGRLEDAINSKALDSIGDTVLENGAPVEDYIDELEGGMQ